MNLYSGAYEVCFSEGGLTICKNGKVLYFNKRPMYAFIKTMSAITEFYDATYEYIVETEDGIKAGGILRTPAGSELEFTDLYKCVSESIKVERMVKVVKESTDRGFATKLSLVMGESDEVREYNYFAPAAWYRQNQFTNPSIMGYDLEAEYFWNRETAYPLPMFAVQNKTSNESVTFSRWASDVGECSYDLVHSEDTVDESITVGSIGFSKPTNKSLDVLYYGYEVRKQLPTAIDGLSIDYVYPGADGQQPRREMGYQVDYMKRSKTMRRLFHPMRKDFVQQYAIGIHLEEYKDYYQMMRETWRGTYKRLRDPLFEVDHKAHYTYSMESLTKLTNQYGDAWGLPFACQLPSLDASSVSFQFGFVGQQPGIGYQLIRYGDKENKPEAYQKGLNIIDFWVRSSMTDIGAPMNCYNPNIQGFEPMPFWTRMIADGLENILDAYVYMKKKGEDKERWLVYLKKAADWLVSIQNEDGSFYRAYNVSDGSMRMDSKANTISVVRFLIQIYLVTGEEIYKSAALRAGEWSYANVYKNMEYRGSTCDNTDIMDNESGIYAMFGFMALYDLTGESKWLEALIGAADYTETWTYAWSFPVRVLWPNHPFTKNRISGQSPVTIGGGGGGDMYMAACAYMYYRLYIITKDEHYRDIAEFVHNNTRQANDVDGSFGYAYPGLSHEGGYFLEQTFMGHYHWLPWVTYVEIDPVSRLVDTFGAYDIKGCDELSWEEKVRRNKIYENYK